MKYIKALFEKTLIYKLYLVCRFGWYYIEDKINICPIFHGDDFLHILQTYLYGDFKIDYIGRVYGVINPNLDKQGKYDPNRVIIEFDNETTHSQKFTEIWIMKQLNMIKSLYNFHTLFDYVMLDINELPPKGFDNYLLIFSLVSQRNLFKYTKKFFLHLLVYAIIAAIILLIIL